MKQVEFWRWSYVDPETGAQRITSYRMSADDAQQRFPGAEPDVDTIEWRDLPESQAEWQTAGRPKR